MNFLKNIFKLSIFLAIALSLLFLKPSITEAKLDITLQDGMKIMRSQESLRDLDFKTWQLVAYPQKTDLYILRIVGYPGSLRIDHPDDLVVRSGIKKWVLKDITLDNPQLANDSREAAVEFNLGPLLLDLTQNRPLRLFLPQAFNELPVPPYLVKEWRSLILDGLEDAEI